MANQLVLQRLAGLQSVLMGVHQSGVGLSSATIGHERAAFVDEFLAKALPPIYRFGTGDATDANGRRSGQLDVVVEYPFAPSLPIGSGQTRLYLAESVAAVVEVKSNLSSQWGDAVRTARALAPLERTFSVMMVMGRRPTARIPLFAVGYTGWNTMQVLENHLANEPHIDGALVIERGLYVSKFGIKADGPRALWGLISDLFLTATSLQGGQANPLTYTA